MNWKVTRPFKSVKFQKDEPICMLVPQKRGELEEFVPEMRNVESDPDLEGRYRHWLEARRAWVKEQKNAAPKKGHAPHQGHYSRGTMSTGEAAPAHQSNLTLQAFLEADEPILDPARETPPVPAPAGFWPRLKNRLRLD